MQAFADDLLEGLWAEWSLKFDLPWRNILQKEGQDADMLEQNSRDAVCALFSGELLPLNTTKLFV